MCTYSNRCHHAQEPLPFLFLHGEYHASIPLSVTAIPISSPHSVSLSPSDSAMERYVLVFAYGAACLLYMFFFMNSNNRWLKVIFKIIPLLILAFGNTSIIMDQAAPFDIKSSSFLPRLQRYNWSLIFCMIGDAYLVFPSLFIYGLISFAIGQGFLLLMFSDDLYILDQLTQSEVISGLCVLALSVAFYMWMYSRFKCAMVCPTLVYTLLISVMLWCAIMQAQKFTSIITLSGAVGAGLFYTSDVMLSVNKWRMRIPMADVVVMATYYIAQLLIATFVALSE